MKIINYCIFLLGFDREVQASKNSAEEALKQIPEIQRIIDEAKNKTDNAKLSLEGARKNAQIARDVVVQAQKEFAEPASEKTEEIRLEADKMRITAGKLRDEAENLAGRVTVTDHKLKGLEKQITSNGSIIDNAKKMVSCFVFSFGWECTLFFLVLGINIAQDFVVS